MTTMDKELIEVFKEFDPDSKGYLNPRVMQKVLKHLGFNPSNKEIEQLIVDVDSSENGKIELDEFIEATKKLTNKTKEIQEGTHQRCRSNDVKKNNFKRLSKIITVYFQIQLKLQASIISIKSDAWRIFS